LLANLSGDRDTRINAILSIPLASSISMAVTADAVRHRDDKNNTDFSAVVQRNLPAGDGYGYRFQTRSDHDSEASVALQNNVGTYTLEAARNDGESATRFNVSGGVALLNGDAFASRRIDQSFGVVRVPGFPGVRVLADNQAAGHTDANGNALLPRLRAYDRNAVSIDQRDLPMDTEIGALVVNATPYFRSGVDVRFPIRHANTATLTILLADGGALPLGATVQVVGQVARAVVGSDGGVYLANLQENNVLHVDWKNQNCEFEVPYAPGGDPLPDLGAYTCNGVSR
jgi:outer membrane usher protein